MFLKRTGHRVSPRLDVTRSFDEISCANSAYERTFSTHNGEYRLDISRSSLELHHAGQV